MAPDLPHFRPDRIAESDIPAATSGAPATAAGEKKRATRGKRGRGPQRRHARDAARLRDGETPIEIVGPLDFNRSTPTTTQTVDGKIERTREVRAVAWSHQIEIAGDPIEAALVELHATRRDTLERRDGAKAGDVRTSAQGWVS